MFDFLYNFIGLKRTVLCEVKISTFIWRIICNVVAWSHAPCSIRSWNNATTVVTGALTHLVTLWSFKSRPESLEWGLEWGQDDSILKSHPPQRQWLFTSGSRSVFIFKSFPLSESFQMKGEIGFVSTGPALPANSRLEAPSCSPQSHRKTILASGPAGRVCT